MAQRANAVESFGCGKEALNRFLIRYALQNQQAGASQTYIALSGDELIRYYTLVVGQVEYTDAPERLTKGLARYPVPIMLLARLAIGQAWQAKSIGAGLLKDAMLRTLQAADIAGIRAFAVLAKDDQARASYERFDLIPSPADPQDLFICLRMFAPLCSRVSLIVIQPEERPGSWACDPYTPAGSKLIFNLVPVAAASFSRVWVEGRVRPLSSRAMTDWLVSMRSASCSWVRPAVVRAAMTACAIFEFRRQGFMGVPVTLVLHPSLVKVFHFGHGTISFARLSASSISLPGVFDVFFTNTRTTTTRRPTEVT